MKNCFPAFVTSLLLFLFLNGIANTPVLYDGTGNPPEHKIAAMTLAGIVNRDAPRL